MGPYDWFIIGVSAALIALVLFAKDSDFKAYEE
jgi:hypothetical protein